MTTTRTAVDAVDAPLETPMRPIVRTFLSLTVAATVAALPTAASATPGNDNGRPAEAHAANQERHGGDVATEDNDSNDGGTANNVSDSGDNAHPSGKDRSVENGRSGNQGKATSDPDDDGRGPDRTNGGVDQPDRAGGVDKADQDGNNGCGNDDDFEDDNEGWCGRHAPHGGPDRDADRPSPRPETDRPVRGGGSGSTRAPATGSQGGTAVTTVEASCPATSVRVTSTKDLSNVVLVFADGDHQRFDGLSGRSGSFSGTGANAGEVIVRVYVKSGANGSGEGPGYGARHDVGCGTTSTENGNSTGNSTGNSNGGVPVVGGDGERPGPGRIPSVDVDPDVDAAGSDRPVGEATEGRQGDEDDTAVLGVVLERPAAPAGVAAAGLAVAPAADVAAADVADEALARTGADTGRAALVAAFALALGGVAVRRTRSA